MKYTPKQRRDIAYGLREVLKMYKADKDRRFLCWVVEEALSSGRIDRRTHINIERIIEGRLGCHASLESWLLSEGHINHQQHDIAYARNGEVFLKCRTTRIAWLKSMIEEFSK